MAFRLQRSRDGICRRVKALSHRAVWNWREPTVTISPPPWMTTGRAVQRAWGTSGEGMESGHLLLHSHLIHTVQGCSWVKNFFYEKMALCCFTWTVFYFVFLVTPGQKCLFLVLSHFSLIALSPPAAVARWLLMVSNSPSSSVPKIIFVLVDVRFGEFLSAAGLLGSS